MNQEDPAQDLVAAEAALDATAHSLRRALSTLAVVDAEMTASHGLVEAAENVTVILCQVRAWRNVFERRLRLALPERCESKSRAVR